VAKRGRSFPAVRKRRESQSKQDAHQPLLHFAMIGARR
jgi:hypothetical protein